MDISQSCKASSLSIASEENNENIKESVQETAPSKESGMETCEASYSMEFSEREVDIEEKSMISKNIKIINDVGEQETSNDKNSDEFDCVHNDEEDLAGRDTVQKEIIEILNVELVAPSRDNFVKSFGSINGVTSELCASIETKALSSSDIEITENANHKQIQNENEREETTMATVEVAPVPAENQHLSNCVEKTEGTKTSGLSLLSQYQSDDDTDSVVEVPLKAVQDYRNQVFEIDSDSDSDDSSSSSDVAYLNELRKTIDKRIADDDDGEDDDQEDCSGKKRHQQKLRVKGELLLEDLPPIQNLQITVPEDDCVELGKIHSIVDQLVLVSTLPNSILLDLETVIFLEKGQKVLGEIFDVLGQVADPLYCVRFNSNKEIKEKQIKIGDVVYVAPKTQYTQYVILSNLMKTSGSDASWENDMEPPPRFLDYSDDEQEQIARKQLRNKDRPNDNEDVSKRPRPVANDDSISTTSSYHSNSQYRPRYEQRNNSGNQAAQFNARPRFNGPHQSQQRASNHRGSWHSNYNPYNFPTQPSNNFRMHFSQNQPQSHQAYHPNIPAYGMPNAHTLSYSSPQSQPYGVSPMFHQHSQHQMPSTVGSIRSPPFHGLPQNGSHHHHYTSTHPPPPGSQ